MRSIAFRQIEHFCPHGNFEMRSWVFRCSLFPIASFLLLGVIHAAGETEGADALRLAPPPTGQTNLIHTMVKVDGHLKIKPPDGPIKSVPMNVTGNLEYEERVVACDPGDRMRRDVRFYRSAEALLQISDAKIPHRLRADRRWIVADTRGDEALLYSPDGPLTRDELELVDTQMSTALLYRLLAADEVTRGTSWPIDDRTLALLLGLDAITESNATATLARMSPPVATIDLEGNVHGAVGGISSDLTVRGSFDYDWTARRFRSVDVTVTEDRAIGHAEPGFRFTARFQTEVTESPATSNWSDERLAAMLSQRTPASLLLQFTPVSGGYQIFHNRDWHLTLDRPDVAILRLIRNGDLIAQCNLSRLPDLPEGKSVTLEAFQDDVRAGLGERFGQFVEASQKRTSEGIRILRAAALGTQSELPIQWIYYHFSDDQGHQAACVFTFDARLAPTFAGEDQALTSSLLFVGSQEPDGTPVRQPAEGRSAAERGSTMSR